MADAHIDPEVGALGTERLRKVRSLAETSLDELLQLAVTQQATDLYIVAGAPPIFLVGGKRMPAPYDAFTSTVARRMVYDILNQEQQRTFESAGELDFRYTLGQAHGFRVRVFIDRKAVACAIRPVPVRPTLESLGLPPVVRALTERTSGLILVGGTNGSGKYATLAAMIDAINATRSEHIVIIDSPVEYFHRDRRSLIRYIEAANDASAIAAALRAEAYEYPPVLLFGRLATSGVIRLAIDSAERGHLVLAPIGTHTAATTVHHVVESFIYEEQAAIRRSLAGALQAILCQQMIPTADASDRAYALEILIATPEIRDAIHKGKTGQIAALLEASAEMGMQTMDQALRELYRVGTITRESALSRALLRAAMDEWIHQQEPDAAINPQTDGPDVPLPANRTSEAIVRSIGDRAPRRNLRATDKRSAPG